MYLKRLVKIILTSLILTLSAQTVFGTTGTFSDVDENTWYAEEVHTAVSSGLMQGTGDGLFSPDGNITIAEAVTIAARLGALHENEVVPVNNSDKLWYQSYVDYALSKDIISENEFDSFDRAAKRHEISVLLRKALPDECFKEKNSIAEIPDVSGARTYHDEILDLYKAGILTGFDEYGNFYPEHSITRAETATIINRLIFSEKRVLYTPLVISNDDAYAMVLAGNLNGNKEGISSGWILDDRGAIPRKNLTSSSYGPIFDIRNDAGVEYIREFNKTSKGFLVLNTSLTVQYDDGAFLEYRNDAGKSVYRLELMNDSWCIKTPNGNFKEVYKLTENEKLFRFEIKTDLDNNFSETRINGEFCGRFPLATKGEESNVFNYRYGTTKESLGFVSPGPTHIYSNYVLREDFSLINDLHESWNVTGNAEFNTNVLLVGEESSVSTAFNPASGVVACEVNILLPEREEVEYRVLSRGKTAAVFTNDVNGFYVNGIKIYEDYYANLWYRIRLELDTDAQKILVKINGITRGTVDFYETVTSVDSVSVSNFSETNATFDDFKVMRIIEHDDYVPMPIIPDGEEKYTIGMNVCSLWRNGTSAGWSCISPYDDPEPVLGYYDEGVPETADWEIKYMVEHGIDFQMFCIYFNGNSGVQKLGATHLFDGFMNAKYSDMTKYCIIWEAANAGSPSSLDAMKNYFAPYIIENFLKDPRYMTIDNKPIICVFGGGSIATRLGSNAKSKEAFDYLEGEAVKLGFDGIIYLACGSSSSSFAEMGYDGCYAYNWGTPGYSLEINKANILSSAKNGAVYTVPTASVGFNSIPWHGVRYPMMTMPDYKELHNWIKEEYLPVYPQETWQKNLVMISTWNEYGEGTYVMPTVDEKGFGYVDILREAYTDEKADPSINTVPTENQKYRINHLYPQYRRLLRRQGWYKEKFNDNDIALKYAINYSDYATTLLKYYDITDVYINADGFSGRSTSTDPMILITKLKDAPVLDDVIAIKITADVPAGTTLQLFYTTEKNNNWNEEMSVKVSPVPESGMQTFVLSAESLKNFEGLLTGIRFDPCGLSNVNFTIKSVEFFVSAYKVDAKELSVNGITFKTVLPKDVLPTGEILVPFEPAVGMDFKLNTFHLWDKKTKTLELAFVEDISIVFKVGSDKYTVNGVEKNLGFEIYQVDGIPMLPLKRICDEVGYEYSVDENGMIEIITNEYEYINEQNKNRVPNQWEFNSTGDTESWFSGDMSIVVNNGVAVCESISNSNDPIITNNETFKIIAQEYDKLEIRVRYKYNKKSPVEMVMYFITDKDTTWNEAKTLRTALKKVDSGEDFETYTIDLTKVSTWKDKVTKLRFDPFNAVGYMEIDYIRFIKAE